MDSTLANALLVVEREQVRIDIDRMHKEKTFSFENASNEDLRDIMMTSNKNAFEKQEQYDANADKGDWTDNPYFSELSGSVLSKSANALNVSVKSITTQLFLLLTLQMYTKQFMRNNPHGPRGTFKASRIRKKMEQDHHSPLGFNAFLLDLMRNVSASIRVVVLAIVSLQIKLGNPTNTPTMDSFCLRMLAMFREVCGGCFLDIKPVISPMDAATRPSATPVNGVSCVAICPGYVSGNRDILRFSLNTIPAFVSQYVSAVRLLVLLIHIQGVFESIRDARVGYATNEKEQSFRADHGLVYNQFFVTFDPFFVRGSNVLHFNKHVRDHRAFVERLLAIIEDIMSHRAWGKNFNLVSAGAGNDDAPASFDSSLIHKFIESVARTALVRHVACHFIRSGKKNQTTVTE